MFLCVFSIFYIPRDPLHHQMPGGHRETENCRDVHKNTKRERERVKKDKIRQRLLCVL